MFVPEIPIKGQIISLIVSFNIMNHDESKEENNMLDSGV